MNHSSFQFESWTEHCFTALLRSAYSMLRVQLQKPHRYLRLAARICQNSPMHCQLVVARPVTSSTNAKPVSDQSGGNEFSFILGRLEMIRKQAARNAVAFERKATAGKVVASPPGGVKLVSDDIHQRTPPSNVITKHKDPVKKKTLEKTHEPADTAAMSHQLNDSPSVNLTTAVRPTSTSSLLGGQAFNVHRNSKLIGLERFVEGTEYVGDWLDGKMHGQGKLICPDGSSYKGAWQHDTRSGAGVATFVVPVRSPTTVSTPEGMATSANDSPQTMETFEQTDSAAVTSAIASYSGNWRNDTFHGTGCYTYPDGTTLSGEFVDGKICNGHGLVRYTSARNERTRETSVYIGDIVDYKRHGQGTYTKADGSVYQGMWAHNRRSGPGLLTYPCGRKIEGTFKNGVLDGRGTITQSDPTLYDYIGAFLQGVPQGDGMQTQRSTGNSYIGSFVDGKRHGSGKLVYGDTNGPIESLEGTWKENRCIGQGRQVNRDGSIIVGTFKHSKVQGELIYPTGEKFVGSISTFPPYAVTGRGTVRTNNSLYKGELANGKKQGPGVYTFNVPNDNPVEEVKTQTYTGLFVDNKMHGRGVLTCSEGSASGEFRDDLLYNGSGKMYVGSVLQWGRWVEGIRQNVAPAISSNDAVETAPPAVDAPGVHEAMGDISASQNPSPPVVQAINSQNMLQGYYTLQVTSSATITGHFVDNNLVGHGVYTHKRNGKIVTYKGPFLNNKPHGTGVTTTMDGVWQSTFENGTQTFGTFTNHEGTHKYVGETVGFNFNGKGKYEYLDYSYDGDFKMGVRHGYGVFTKKDVFFYAGNWVDNKRHGYGVNVNKQHTYKGMHYNDLQHGEGELIYNQGYTYKGTFSKGYMTHGVITTAWGDSHSGEFTRGVRSGKGVFTFREGVSISGTWVEGKLQGVATISSPTSTPATAPTLTNTDGEASIVVTTAPAAPPRSVQGYFENNVLQYQVTDNDSADQVADSLWNTLPVLNNDNNFAPIRGFLSSQVTSEYGSSRILFSDQRVYAGVVTDGKMNGTGMLYSGPSDAKTAPFGKYRLQGVFQNNLPYNCKGVLMDRGTLFQGTWTDGVRQGYAKIVQFNGRLLEGEYVNGKFTIAKDVENKNVSGAVETSTTEITDVPLTRDTVRLEKGLVYTGELSAGVPHGTGKISNSRGEVWEGEFAHGQLVKGFYSVSSYGARANPINGKSGGVNKLVLVYKGEFKDFQYHGQGKLMMKDSVYEGSFEDGLPHGYGKCIDSDSIYEGEYARGKRHGVGFITLPSGEVSEGVWFNDLFQHTAIRPFSRW